MPHRTLERLGEIRAPREPRLDPSIDQRNPLGHVRIDIHG
jgi:hypothetical protein